MCTLLDSVGDKWDENELICILLDCQLDFFNRINVNKPPCSNPSLMDRISQLAWNNGLGNSVAGGLALIRCPENKKCKNFGNI